MLFVADVAQRRGLLTGLHPALERAIGPRINHPAALEILSRCGGPAGALCAALTAAAGSGGDPVEAIGEYEPRMREYGYAAVEASRRAETEMGTRGNSLMFTLYRRFAR